MRKLLRVSAPHFVAGAVWRKAGDGWECERAAPIIKWMVGKSPSFVGQYLKEKGWRYEWIDSF